MFHPCWTQLLAAGTLVFIALLLLASGPAQAQSCSPPPAGLVSWWPGDGNANDLVGSGNGSLQGGATATAAGLVAQAFGFNGTTAFVQIPDSPALRPTNFTVEAWVLFTSLNSSGNSSAGQQYIVFKQNTRSSFFEGIYLGKERRTSGDVFSFGVSSAAGQFVGIDSSAIIATGVWYHVAGVRGSNFLQLYLNGVLAGQVSVSFPQSYGTLPLYFGTSGQSYWDHKLAGLLDEVSLYNRALLPSEIAAIYAAGSAGKCKTTSDPAITAQPQNQSVAAGGTALFTVTATGTAPLSYQWRFGGAPISGASNSNLPLSNVQTADAGNYTVVVSNALGASVTSAVAVLTVLGPPVMIGQPQSRTNLAGTTATFSVSVTGTAPLTYQWRSNGVNLANSARLSGATTPMLSIASVQPADAADYSVVVTNAAGSVTSMVATLTVLVPPSITTPPASQNVNVGTNARFSVTAAGTQPLSYQWLFNGSRLTDGTQFSGTTTPTLWVTNAQPPNQGSYAVVVTNLAGAVTSAVATLTVTVPGSCAAPPAGLVSWWPADGNANDLVGSGNGLLQGGATATAAGLVAQAFGFNGTTAFVQIPDSPALRPTNFTVEAWVLFTSLNSSGNSSAGQQYIVFKQNTRSSFFEGIYLGKERRTSGDVFSFGVSSAAGQFVGIDSSAIIATGVWYHVAGVRGSNFLQLYLNGVLAGQVNVSFPQSYGTLPLYFGTSGQSYWDRKLAGLLDEVSLYNRALLPSEIAAIYAAGSAGKCKTPQPPMVAVPPQNQSVAAGGTALFTVTATGTTPLSYQWVRNGLFLSNGGTVSGATSSALSLANVQLSDSGAAFQAIVTNSAGSVTSAVAVLTVTPAPTPPTITVQPVSQLLVVGSTTSFSVSATGTAPLTYQWQRNGSNLGNGGRISGATSTTLTLANVQTTDAGNYQVVVSNAGGSVTSLVATLSANAPPANDAFAQAQTISGSLGSIVGANFNATKETGEPDHAGNPGGHSIWYQWTAPSSSPVTFDTALSDFDTLLAVYTGNAVNALVLITANDDMNTNTPCSRLTFTPTPGAVYKIAVDGANGVGGNVTLRWAQASAPLPDLIVLGSTANPAISTETFSASSCAVIEGLIQAGTRRIIRFNTQTANLGTADLILGNPANNPLFEYAACHGHYHFHNYMAYRLRDTNGITVALGQKIGFCILDVAKVDPNAPAFSSAFTCTYQGIHRGWSDIYDHTLDGQWVDITGVPNGNYVLELEVNPAGTLQETDYSKNITYVPISIGGTTTAPLNDNFANAQLLVGGSPTTTGSTLNATKQTGEPNHAGNAGGHSIWYQWTALATKPVIIDTVASSFDTLLAVYTGTSVNALTPVASNDDIGNPTNLQSRVTFNAVAGTVYRIAVDGYNGAVGNVVLTLNQSIDNDNFDFCTFEGGTSGTAYGTDVGATKEPGEPNHAGNPGGHSIWYCWTAPLNGAVTFDTLGSTFDTLLAIYTGDTLATLSLVASNDDVSASIKQSQVTFNAMGTTMYHIAIDGFNGASGNVTLHWNLVPSAAAPPLLASAPANRPTLTGGLSPQGEFQLFLAGDSQQRYRLEMSEDLIHWTPLPNPVVAGYGQAILTEKAGGSPQPTPTGALDSRARFYRAVLLAPD